MDHDDGWFRGLPPFPIDASTSGRQVPRLPADPYMPTMREDPAFPGGMAFSQGVTPGPDLPSWGLTPSYGHVQASASLFPGHALAGGDPQTALGPFNQWEYGGSSYAIGFPFVGPPAHDVVPYYGRTGPSEAELSEANRRADAYRHESAVAWRLLREAREGQMSAVAGASRAYNDSVHYASQLSDVQEHLAVKEAELAHLLGSTDRRIEAAKWEGFENAIVDMLRVNPNMYICTSFVVNHQVPLRVQTALAPYIAFIPPHVPAMNLSLNGVSFSVAFHPPGVASTGSVAGGLGDYIPQIEHFARDGEGVEDVAGDEGEGVDDVAGEEDEGVDDDDHMS